MTNLELEFLDKLKKNELKLFDKKLSNNKSYLYLNAGNTNYLVRLSDIDQTIIKNYFDIELRETIANMIENNDSRLELTEIDRVKEDEEIFFYHDETTKKYCDIAKKYIKKPFYRVLSIINLFKYRLDVTDNIDASKFSTILKGLYSFTQVTKTKEMNNMLKTIIGGKVTQKLYDVIISIGKDEAISRIDKFLDYVNTNLSNTTYSNEIQFPVKFNTSTSHKVNKDGIVTMYCNTKYITSDHEELFYNSFEEKDVTECISKMYRWLYNLGDLKKLEYIDNLKIIQKEKLLERYVESNFDFDFIA